MRGGGRSIISICLCVYEHVCTHHGDDGHACPHIRDADLHKAGFGEIDGRCLKLCWTLKFFHKSICCFPYLLTTPHYYDNK